jgi:hypothetical protein
MAAGEEMSQNKCLAYPGASPAWLNNAGQFVGGVTVHGMTVYVPFYFAWVRRIPQLGSRVCSVTCADARRPTPKDAHVDQYLFSWLQRSYSTIKPCVGCKPL